MKKYLIYLLMLSMAPLAVGCDDDDEVSDESIFPTGTVERNAFDTWLLNNYTYPYNVEVLYRLEDIESDMDYNLVPATYGNSVRLSKLIKHLWMEAYDEVCGPEFLRTYCPRVIHMVGSPAYNTSGEIVLGTAEGGMKITLYNVNSVEGYLADGDMEQLNFFFFKTMHHEFAHILHQTKYYPSTFEAVSGNYTSSNWINIEDDEALQMGFVTPYGSSAVHEDFVEIISVYVTHTAEEWEAMMQTADVQNAQTGKTGREVIEAKLQIVREYLRDSWNFSLDSLREVVQRRSSEIKYLDLENL